MNNWTWGSGQHVSNTFQVDLRGVVDLLSQHLYSSPRVYLRELLQNAVDAITARQDLVTHGEPDVEARPATAPSGRVRIEVVPSDAGSPGLLRVHDNGIGLTEQQVHDVLATIGRSSKRDELGFARHEFLGQFGIGLLSCFVVADEIMVITRGSHTPTVSWTGHSDGRYEVSLPSEQRSEQGTTVVLRPRRGAEHWLAESTVRELATLYGSLLPTSVTVNDVEVTESVAPWSLGDDSSRLRKYCSDTFGVESFDTIALSAPEAGLTGVAFVLTTPTSPTARAGHRVYLKRMLLTESAHDLLPSWAFFARCVVDATELRPTASREALYDDGLLESVRETLGGQLRGWIVGLAARDPHRLSRFLGIHQLGVKAMAVHDDDMLRVVDQWMPLETNVGQLTLADFRQRYGLLRYSPTTDQFRQLAAVAAAQNIPLINGGYVYDSDLIERLAVLDPSTNVERLDPTDLATHFESVDPGVELSLRPFLAAAQQAMDPLGAEIVLRSFEPLSLPTMYLVDRDAAFRGELRATKEKADPIWAGVLSALDFQARDVRPQLVLNYRNPLIRRISLLSDPALVRVAVEALYGQALLLGYHPIRPAQAALLNRSFLGLLDRAVPGEVTP